MKKLTHDNPERQALGLALYVLHSRLLFAPLPTGTGWYNNSAARVFRDRCQLFVAGRWQALFNAVPEAPTPLTDDPAPAPTRQDAIPQFDLGLHNIRAGRLSAAYRTIISNGAASYGTDTLDKLDALTFIPMLDDPSALSAAERAAFDAFRLGPLCDEDDYLITQDTLAKLIETLPSGVSPGPTGLRNEHLKEAATTGLGAQAVEGIIQLLARGELGAPTNCGADYSTDSSLANPHLLDGSRLAALKKKAANAKLAATDVAAGRASDTHVPVRPLGMGGVERRLAGRALLTESKPNIVKLFLKHNQFAMAPDGATTVVRAISLAHSLHPDYVLFTNDSASAFQKKSRSAIERRLIRHFPRMVPFYKVYYNDPSNLYYGLEYKLSSSTGAIQGCPLGSFLYCLADLDILEQLQADFSDCLILAYVDDIYILGPPASAATAFARLKELKEHRGEACNVEKCKAFSFVATSLAHTAVQAVDP